MEIANPSTDRLKLDEINWPVDVRNFFLQILHINPNNS